MAYEPIDTEELKKRIKMGKKRPMNFAYNPGPKGADMLLVHRIKAPEVLGRIAKKEGEGTKVTFGTFEVAGRKISLTVSRVLPGLAKKLRRYFKSLEMPFKVEVLDASGALLEVEDEDEAQDEAQPVAPAHSSGAAPQPAQEAEPAPSRAALAGRVQALQEPITALGPAAAPHAKAAKGVIALIKAGKLAQAETALSTIETSLASVAAEHNDSQQAETPDDPAPDGRALVARATALKQAMDALPPDRAATVRAPLARAVAALQAGDNAGADAQLAEAEALLNTPPPDPDQQKWQATQGPLAQQVAAAMQAGKGDLDAINRAFGYAQEQAADGNYASAVRAAATTIRLLQEAATAPATARVAQAQADAPDNIVAYTRSRLNWISTRNDLLAELVKLKMTIDAQVAGVEGLEEVAQNTGVLLDYMEDLDSTLEATLEALVETPEGDGRTKLKAEAMQIITAYRATLDTDFFKAVDDNGFIDTSIRSTALTALGQVETALAA